MEKSLDGGQVVWSINHNYETAVIETRDFEYSFVHPSECEVALPDDESDPASRNHPWAW